MTISEQDEREAINWLGRCRGMSERDNPTTDAKHYATILALLDRPRMLFPDDAPDSVLIAIAGVLADDDILDRPHAIYHAARRALYGHYNPPPAPKKVEAWLVVFNDGKMSTHLRQEAAENEARFFPERQARIVHLVEADHD